MKNNIKTKLIRFLWIPSYSIFETVLFSVSLLVLIIFRMIAFVFKKLFLKRIANLIEKLGVKVCKYLFNIFSFKTGNGISQIDIIELAIKNLSVKKTRTIITVGGMMVGVGAIVFLVSLGYGVQNLVISRVAELEEMKQTDVFLQNGRKMKITDKTINDFANISGVEMALPLISSVGRINYNGSNSDVAVYGVQSDYLKRSAIHQTKGEFFESNKTFISQDELNNSELQKNSADKNDENGNKRFVEFSINSGEWIKVRESRSLESEIIGYTRKTTDFQKGFEMEGEFYEDSKKQSTENEDIGNKVGMWIEADVLLWENRKCDIAKDFICEDGEYVPLMDENNKQALKKGYLDEIKLSEIKDAVEELSPQTAVVENTMKAVELNGEGRLAVVNNEMLKIMGISEDSAVGKSFMLTFILNGEQLSSEEKKIESAPVKYTIVGVIPGEKTPIMYVPFIDLRMLGVNNYSQARIIIDDEKNLSFIRKQVEAMGYTTSSVVDTINQINDFFANVRIALGFFGSIALSVAALGMFNTLTVSLLERTREIGLLKALGMKSAEVKKMFLTESMTMGFLGGILGIIFGFLAGKATSIALTAFSLFKGEGALDISFIPTSFILLIVSISVLTGFLTGIYPARRATKISALNALRYE